MKKKSQKTNPNAPLEGQMTLEETKPETEVSEIGNQKL